MITALQRDKYKKKKIYWIRWQRIQALFESCRIRVVNLQYWCQLFAIERNGSYGNAALKLKKVSPLKSLFEVNLNQINSLAFRLTGSTTTASVFAIFEERSNLQWDRPMTSRHKIIVPILSSKVNLWFVKGIIVQQRNSRALTKGNLRFT